MVKRLIIVCILLIASISCAATLIQFKRGTEATLPSTGSAGEPLFTTDTKRFFIGTGSGREEFLRVRSFWAYSSLGRFNSVRYTNLSTAHARTRAAYQNYSTHWNPVTWDARYTVVSRFINLSTAHNRTRTAHKNYSTNVSSRWSSYSPKLSNYSTVKTIATGTGYVTIGNQYLSSREVPYVVWVGNSDPVSVNSTGVDNDYYFYSSLSALYQKSGGTWGLLGSVTTTVPTTSTSSCVKGQVAVGSNYIYGCYSTNKWTRSSSATW